jgi:SAM-dependent methyltransferase
LHERDRILQEVYRILRPGGRVLFNDLAADICAPEHHPTAYFMRQAGGRELARRFMSARCDLSGGHVINPLALMSAESYPEYLARWGFHHARARYFCSPEFTRMGYATHDAEYLFGLADVEITPWYRAWVEDVLFPLMLDDQAASHVAGGSFIFVGAEK